MFRSTRSRTGSTYSCPLVSSVSSFWCASRRSCTSIVHSLTGTLGHFRRLRPVSSITRRRVARTSVASSWAMFTRCTHVSSMLCVGTPYHQNEQADRAIMRSRMKKFHHRAYDVHAYHFSKVRAASVRLSKWNFGRTERQTSSCSSRNRCTSLPALVSRP